MSKKAVLVQVGKFSRKLTLACEDESTSDYELLQQQVRSTFQHIDESDELTFQVKDKDFDGMYVDFLEGESVADKSIFRVMAEKKSKPEVSL